MRIELLNTSTDLVNYFLGAAQKVKPFIVILVTIINYILFPDNAYVPSAIGLCGALLLDIITKYYALQKPHKGIMNAIKAGAIRSERFWAGTKKKIIGYLVVMILCGLSVRVTPIVLLSTIVSTVAYSIMFLREAQSCIENLIEAGHDDLNWFLLLLKRRQKNILDQDEPETNKPKNK